MDEATDLPSDDPARVEYEKAVAEEARRTAKQIDNEVMKAAHSKYPLVHPLADMPILWKTLFSRKSKT